MTHYQKMLLLVWLVLSVFSLAQSYDPHYKDNYFYSFCKAEESLEAHSHFCDPFFDFFKSFLKPSHTTDECEACESSVAYLKKEGHVKRIVENFIDSISSRFCDSLDFSVRENCKTWLSTYSTNIKLLAISEIDNGTFCSDLLKCRKDISKPIEVGSVEKSKSFPMCNYCLKGAKVIEERFLTSLNIPKIIDSIDKYVCRNAPMMIYFNCNKFALDIGTKLTKIILKFQNSSKLCSDLHICPSSSLDDLHYFAFPHFFHEEITSENICTFCDNITEHKIDEFENLINLKEWKIQAYSVFCDESSEKEVCKSFVDRAMGPIVEQFKTLLNKKNVCHDILRCPLKESEDISKNWFYHFFQKKEKKNTEVGCYLCEVLSKNVERIIHTDLIKEVAESVYRTSYCTNADEMEKCERIGNVVISLMIQFMSDNIKSRDLCDNLCPASKSKYFYEFFEKEHPYYFKYFKDYMKNKFSYHPYKYYEKEEYHPFEFFSKGYYHPYKYFGKEEYYPYHQFDMEHKPFHDDFFKYKYFFEKYFDFMKNESSPFHNFDKEGYYPYHYFNKEGYYPYHYFDKEGYYPYHYFDKEGYYPYHHFDVEHKPFEKNDLSSINDDFFKYKSFSEDKSHKMDFFKKFFDFMKNESSPFHYFDKEGYYPNHYFDKEGYYPYHYFDKEEYYPYHHFSKEEYYPYHHFDLEYKPFEKKDFSSIDDDFFKYKSFPEDKWHKMHFFEKFFDFMKNESSPYHYFDKEGYYPYHYFDKEGYYPYQYFDKKGYSPYHYFDKEGYYPYHYFDKEGYYPYHHFDKESKFFDKEFSYPFHYFSKEEETPKTECEFCQTFIEQLRDIKKGNKDQTFWRKVMDRLCELAEIDSTTCRTEMESYYEKIFKMIEEGKSNDEICKNSCKPKDIWYYLIHKEPKTECKEKKFDQFGVYGKMLCHMFF